MTYYLSRLSLRPEASKNPAFWRQLTQQRDLDTHSLLWSFISSGQGADAQLANSADTRHLLYRQEGQGADLRFFAVTSRPPQPEQQSLWDVETRPYAPALRVGQKLQFLVRLNATKRIPDQPTKRTDVVMALRHALASGVERSAHPWQEIAPYAALSWLARRGDTGDLANLTHSPSHGPASRWGCTFDAYETAVRAGGQFSGVHLPAALPPIDPALLSVDAYTQHQIWRKRGTPPMRLSSLDIRGVLTVTDPTLFTNNVLYKGIGDARSFGFGMVMVKPLAHT